MAPEIKLRTCCRDCGRDTTEIGHWYMSRITSRRLPGLAARRACCVSIAFRGGSAASWGLGLAGRPEGRVWLRGNPT
jgi:hypothetical protein